jgi:hypothetical protein
MKIRPVGAELFHADGRKDMTRLIVPFCNLTNEPKNWEIVENLRQNLFCSPYYLEALDMKHWLLHLSVKVLYVPELNYTAP